MMQPSNAAKIAAQIDVNTTGGHNLRAFLLRRVDGVRADAPHGMWSDARNRGFLDDEDGCVTTLGREVAELLRPAPWTVTTNRGFPRLIKPNGAFAAEMAGELDLCQRIAALLTTDDLHAVKQYRTEPTP